MVERVIQLQLRQEGASRNVLCFGYGQVGIPLPSLNLVLFRNLQVRCTATNV